jgi:glycosyltransferase involved in cell wall biosynthesis
MRVLVLSKYGRQAASARHRLLAYQPHLAAQGIEMEFSPLLNDEYLQERLEGGSANAKLVAFAYLRRVVALASVRNYDLVLVHKEIFPYFPAWVEQLLARLKIPYIVDYDDAVFHMYDDHSNKVVRQILGSKMSRVLAGARAVIAGSEYLAAYARRFNPRVHVVPTVVDMERYPSKNWNERGQEQFTIGWIGSPSTAPYLDLVREPLVTFCRETSACLSTMGAPGYRIENLELMSHRWSEATEVDFLRKCDVGIMPLSDEKWARGKCAFKLIQYMACGLPVIASPVGANIDVVTPQVGYLADTHAGWLTALQALYADRSLRRNLGLAGRLRCEVSYSLASQEERVAQIIRDSVR